MNEEEMKELRKEMKESDESREPCHHVMTNGSECGSFHPCCHSCTFG